MLLVLGLPAQLYFVGWACQPNVLIIKRGRVSGLKNFVRESFNYI